MPGLWLVLVFGVAAQGGRPNLSAHSPGSLAARINAALQENSTVRRAHWGIQVTRLVRGETLYQKNAHQYFTPASNAKLFTTALALLRLGPDYRFETLLAASAVPQGGVLPGDLRLIGGGDPTLSARAYPYQPGPATGDPLSAIETFADAVSRAGIRQVTGSVVADDTRWPFDPYPSGWAITDTVWEYGAPVSALTINDNFLELRVTPGAEGAPARIAWWPALEYYWVDNQIRTEASGSELEVLRLPGSRQLRLLGRIEPHGAERQEAVAIDDPAYFAAYTLQQALTKRGIRIDGPLRAEHRALGAPSPSPPPSLVLARRESPPLRDILTVVNKASQNLHTEMLLRETGLLASGEGTTEAGLGELRKLLTELGVGSDEYDLRDGSGLSRLNLVTPATTVQLLRHLWNSPHRATWLATLPVGGQDGTLRNRFQFPRRQGSRWPHPETVKAKTGTLSHVAALAGYLESKTWGPVAFSIMANHFRGPASEIRDAIDKICLEIAK